MFKNGDQVVVKVQTNRSGPMTREVKVGQIAAMGQDGATAFVNLPMPGGRTTRKEIAVKDLAAVSHVFGRTSVQLNPAFRQIYRGSV